MGLRRSTRNFVDKRICAQDIKDSFRKNSFLGSKIEALARVGKRLTNFLRSDALTETK